MTVEELEKSPCFLSFLHTWTRRHSPRWKRDFLNDLAIAITMVATEPENRIYPKARQARHGHTERDCYLTLRLSDELNEAILREAGTESDKSKVVRRILCEHFGLLNDL